MDISGVAAPAAAVTPAVEQPEAVKEVHVNPVERALEEEKEQTGGLLEEFTGKGKEIDVVA
jgi:hypothetical protein